jgi:hypothetical protein
LGDNAGPVNQSIVYDFVQSHKLRQSSNYDISAKYEDHDAYNHYLLNLIYTARRVQSNLSGKNSRNVWEEFFCDLERKNKTEKEQYDAVRKGIPKVFSVAVSTRPN